MLYKILMKIIIMYEEVYWVVRRTTLSIEEIVGEAAVGCFSHNLNMIIRLLKLTTVTRPQRYLGTVYVVQHA